MCVQCSPDFRGEMLTAHDRRTTLHTPRDERAVGVTCQAVWCVSAPTGGETAASRRGARPAAPASRPPAFRISEKNKRATPAS